MTHLIWNEIIWESIVTAVSEQQDGGAAQSEAHCYPLTWEEWMVARWSIEITAIIVMHAVHNGGNVHAHSWFYDASVARNLE